jgi:hypothetical protein
MGAAPLWNLLKDDVLPDGPTALGHPANEDLFAGTPVRRPLRGVYTFLATAVCIGPPLVGIISRNKDD